MSIRQQIYQRYFILGLVAAVIPGFAALLTGALIRHFLPVAIPTVCAVIAAPFLLILIRHEKILGEIALMENLAASIDRDEGDPLDAILRSLLMAQRDSRDREQEQSERNCFRLIERLLGNNQQSMIFDEAQSRLDMLKENVLEMPYSDFFLICIRVDDYNRIFHQRGQNDIPMEDYLGIRSSIDETMRRYLPAEAQLHCIEYQGYYICLINQALSNEESIESDLSSTTGWCEQAILELDTAYSIMSTATLSSPFHSIDHTHEAMQECISLFRFSNMLSLEKPVVSMLDVPQGNDEANDHQSQLWKKYIHAVTTLDIPKAKNLLLEMLSPRFVTTLHQAESVNSMVLYHLGVAFETLGIVVDKRPELALICREIASAHSLDEIYTLVEQVFDQISDIKIPETGKKENKILQIQQYIDQHYMDPDLCAASLGDQFSINPSYMVRVFKDVVGQSILAYVQQCRVNHAKKLLETTDLNLTDIAMRSGYASGWTLTRAFKRTEGITPGAYRQLCQNNSITENEGNTAQ